MALHPGGLLVNKAGGGVVVSLSVCIYAHTHTHTHTHTHSHTHTHTYTHTSLLSRIVHAGMDDYGLILCLRLFAYKFAQSHLSRWKG